MSKIAGYILEQHIDQGDAWLNAVDPKSVGPTPAHRQCAWNDERLHNLGEVEIIEYITLENAEKYICDYCNEKLSEPAYFSFEEKYKWLHQRIGWIQVISHEVMFGPDHYRDVIDSADIVCLDCEAQCPDYYETLTREESKNNYTCSACNKPMILQGKESLKEAENGACSLIQLFHFEEFGPGYFVAVKKYRRKYNAIYELYELKDAEALYEALLKVSA